MLGLAAGFKKEEKSVKFQAQKKQLKLLFLIIILAELEAVIHLCRIDVGITARGE
jgi:hypothetical protein